MLLKLTRDYGSEIGRIEDILLLESNNIVLVEPSFLDGVICGSIIVVSHGDVLKKIYVKEFPMKIYEKFLYNNAEPKCCENNGAELKTYPVCECGYIFYDLKYSFKDRLFMPNICPSCGRVIKGLSYKPPTKKDEYIDFSYE